MVHSFDNGYKIYAFQNGNPPFFFKSAGYCSRCNKYRISYNCALIIRQLRNAGLLPKDYKLLCCKCHSELKSMGSLEAKSMAQLKHRRDEMANG